MRISVNGEVVETKATNLAQLLSELGYEGDWLATAINAEVVTAVDRPSHNLQENDRIEILSPMQGG